MDESLGSLLRTFKERIDRAFPGFVEEVLLFGSQARGTADDTSDIDVLVVTANSDWRKGDEIRRIGYELDILIDARLSIQVLPRSHIQELKRDHFRFIQNVERDCIAV